MSNQRSPSPRKIFFLAIFALTVIWSCRAADLANDLRAQRAGATTVPTVNVAVEEPSPTETLAAVTELPTDTLEPEPTELPTDTSAPTNVPTPRATRTPAPPTRPLPPTATFTPAPPPSPTRCPDKYCVIKANCVPGDNTRAIGTVYENGVPKNGIRVRVSYDYGGAPVAEDFISGHDPVNRQNLDPAHPGYYQVGIRDGSALDGNWWVFLMDEKQNVISEGRYFKTTDVVTADSCQIGVTDFGK